ncbi:hypothetical protein RFI_19619 [Reticulomyxa filosa]|uniref:Uncharacterized protein n=1 Tax=Reticulomyxa filosa TaxID=46433 RepID=X6MUN2_RETFI|nr:hypothetical protein RFI_19619 [Reticulomyxa filosa]|eukprot:ETO17698.1 hypothetical protein RFI_19619 [Reticulomyxa filosa]
MEVNVGFLAKVLEDFKNNPKEASQFVSYLNVGGRLTEAVSSSPQPMQSYSSIGSRNEDVREDLFAPWTRLEMERSAEDLPPSPPEQKISKQFSDPTITVTPPDGQQPLIEVVVNKKKEMSFKNLPQSNTTLQNNNQMNKSDPNVRSSKQSTEQHASTTPPQTANAVNSNLTSTAEANASRASSTSNNVSDPNKKT